MPRLLGMRCSGYRYVWLIRKECLHLVLNKILNIMLCNGKNVADEKQRAGSEGVDPGTHEQDYAAAYYPADGL